MLLGSFLPPIPAPSAVSILVGSAIALAVLVAVAWLRSVLLGILVGGFSWGMIAFVVWANAQRYRGDELNILFCTIVGSFLGAVSGGIIVATKKIIGLSRPPWDSTE